MVGDAALGGDRDLVARCAGGDQRAWAELIGRHDRQLLIVLLRASPGAGAAELSDLRQEVWVRLLERGALAGLRLERPGALGAYLCRVALRVAIDQARARGARPRADAPVEEAHELPGGADPEREAALAQARLKLAHALLRSNEGPNGPRDLMVLRAHFQDGLNPAEIAAMGVGLSAKGVETLLRRARERIETELSEPALRSG